MRTKLVAFFARFFLLVAWFALGVAFSARAAEPGVTLTVQTDRPGGRISPTLWGVFFEDINLGGDGGLYAELLKNRSFEFPEPLMGWTEIKRDAAGTMAILDQKPLNDRNPHLLRVKVEAAKGSLGLANEGFRGIGVREGALYNFSVHARAAEGGPQSLLLELISSTGQVIGSTNLAGFGRDWKPHSVSLRSAGTDPKARLNVLVQGRGTLDLDMVSLFPKNTWKNRTNGLRADLVQWLKDLQPGFLRFPGGCIVEGRDLSTRYQWKNTIGSVAERRLLINRWNTEFKHRPAPDYFQTFGLGFFEYFRLSEDIGAEPLPILNCGMACQFNTGQLVPIDQLEPYIQDALDLIEFANGPASSPWGQKRAAMGHPAPFNLKLLGVGNEQWGPQYFERYERFVKVLKAKHPEVTLISSAGPSPADDRFNLAWTKLRELKAEVVDEHCYDKPAWFISSASRYDSYDRKGPKVFMGEYAAQSDKTVSPQNRNNWECALAEAVFMTGLERNAEVVTMSSYAPLFGHEEGWQWRPNLIWFDNLRSYGTPSYYVQQLFSLNRGDLLLPVQIADPRPNQSPSQRLYATASRDEQLGQIILKVVNPHGASVPAGLKFSGVSKFTARGRAFVLSGAQLTDENSLAEPTKVAPVTRTIDSANSEFGYTFRPSSLTVIRLTLAR